MKTISVSLSPALNIQLYEGLGGLGTRTWPSAVGLARWVVGGEQCDITGLRVLECGSGTGLVSLAFAARGASVLTTDVDKNALRLTELAAEAQGLGSNCKTQPFDIFSSQPLPQCDLLVAADVIYSEALATAFAKRCDEIIRKGGRAIVADPGRPTRRAFHESLALACNDTYTACVRTAAEVGSFDEWVRAPAAARSALLMLHVEAEEDAVEVPTDLS